MAQLIVTIGALDGPRAASVLAAFKGTDARRDVNSDWYRLTVLQRANDVVERFGIDAEARRWVSWAGTWFHPDAPYGTAEELLAVLRRKDLLTVGRELEGFFALVIGDERERKVRVITDRCGSCHIFAATTRTDTIISTSSAALAASSSASFDPIGVQEFVATGIIYGERTLWDGVKKLPPASICSFSDSRSERTSYWSFAQLQPERLALADAVQTVSTALTNAATTLGKRFKRPVCDVTGGYDSRACLAGLLAAGVRVDATVSGAEHSGDVRVSKKIATQFGLRHIHATESSHPTLDDLMAAVRLTDGEYDAFDYARIRSTHLLLSVDHDVSINGSFGELARGYWWELLFPRIGRKVPIDLQRLIAARFTADAYDASIFARGTVPDLSSQIQQVAADAVAPLAGFPNTTQLDCVYFMLRMQRWQGRIASSTDQLWPCLSPFSFPSLLVPVLEAKASARIGSRLVREMIDQLSPQLAAIELEHGYPAQPLRASNAVRFLPLFGHLAHRAIRKSKRILAKRLFQGGTVRMSPVSAAPSLSGISGSDAQLKAWLAEPLLSETGLFKDDRLAESLAGPNVNGKSVGPQWTRLATLEMLMRDLGRARAYASLDANSRPAVPQGTQAA